MGRKARLRRQHDERSRGMGEPYRGKPDVRFDEGAEGKGYGENFGTGRRRKPAATATPHAYGSALRPHSTLRRKRMKRGQIFFAVAMAFSVFSAQVLMAAELTGFYHKALGIMRPAYLEIDGPGFVKKIPLDGNALKDITENQHIWVSGEINSFLQGNPRQVSVQEQPTQWIVMMSVNEWKPIKDSFERPK